MSFLDKLLNVCGDVWDACGDAWDSTKSAASFITTNTAKNNFKRADRIVKYAKEDFDIARSSLEKQRRQCATELENLGKLRLEVQDDKMQRMVETTSNISNIEYKQLEFDNYQAVFEAPSVKTIEMSAYEATDIIKDGIQAVSTGTLAGVGAFGVATSFGIASTGTAISTLSGAAATNATLAWLGGGSLAAGGLGIAGGSAVLGGIIAIPALLVFAAKTTAKSEEALTQAFEQQAEYEIATHEAESLIAKVACVTARVQETYEVTEEMAKYFEIILSANQSTVSAKMDQKEQLRKETEASRAKYAKRFFLLRWLDKALGKEPSFEYEDPLDFSNFSEHDRKSYLMMLSFGFALYAVLKVKILEEDGSLASDAQVLINSGRDMLRRKS